MADVKQLVQNILEKNAVGAKEQFSAILEQKIATIIEDVIPLISENMVSDGEELEEKAKFDDDEGDEHAEKKARKDKERQRSDARQSKKKEVEEEVDLQEKIAGSEYAPADLVDLHVTHQKHLMDINNHLMSGRSVTSIADTVTKAKKLEGQINKHPQTLAFHTEHGFDADHPAKKIARNTAHLHEEKKNNILSRILTNLAEKAKFDDEDGSEHEEKSEKKKKELARSKAREAKKQDSED